MTMNTRARRLAALSLAVLSLGISSALGTNALAAGIEPLHVELRIEGKPFEGENCEGGEWYLSWRGELPGESNNVGDQLISYSAFDTTQEGDRVDPPATLTVKPITCRDNQGRVVLQTSMAGGTRKIRGVLALKDDAAMRSPFFDFYVEDVGICRFNSLQMNQVSASNVFQIRTSLVSTFTPELSVSREEMTKGFTKRFAVGGQVISSATMCMGTPVDHGEVILSYKSNDRQPTLGLSGCAVLPRGASTEVTAKVEPPGGSLKFLAEPAATLGLQPKSSSVTVTAAAPGRATLKGEYTYNGKTAAATLPAASVELVSINSGQPVRKLGLLGPNGRPSSKVYTFPFQSNPADAGDLLIFTAEHDAIVSVVTNRNSIGVQPVREGRTRIQAKTTCGAPVGPPIEIEIATCDDEARGELQRHQEELIKREQDIARRITRLVADSEFQRAATDIKEDTITLATKTAELIAATLTVGEASAVKNGTSSALNLSQIETAQSIWSVADIIKDANEGNIPAAAFSTAVELIGKASLSAAKAAGESIAASRKFGMDLGLIAGVVEQLEMLEPKRDAVHREIFDVTRRLNQCDKLPPPPPLPPKKPDPKPPRPTEPTPVPVPPATDIPTTPEPLPTPPPTEQPPPPIEQPPVSRGLCVRRVDDAVPPATDLRTLLNAANQYRTVAQRAQEVFDQFAATVRDLEQANALAGAARATALQNLQPRYDAFTQQYFQLGAQSRAQEQRFALCTEVLPKQVDQVRKASPQP